MKLIKQQLQDFYKARGVGRRRAEKMVKSDLASAKREMIRQLKNSNSELGLSAAEAHAEALIYTQRRYDLMSAFVWHESVEGKAYWHRRSLGCQATTENLRGLGLL